MKSFIPHKILVINDQVSVEQHNSTLSQCYALAFDWANRMGLEGKRVFDLLLKAPDYHQDPLNCQSVLWCKIECSEEDRKIWEETNQINLEIAILKSLSE